MTLMAFSLTWFVTMAVLVSHPVGHVRQATEWGPVGEVGLLRGAILALPLEQARAERKPEHSPSKKQSALIFFFNTAPPAQAEIQVRALSGALGPT